jgi:hypothetical protein
MFISRKRFAFVATLAALCCVAATGALSARAATPACGKGCASVFSKALGNPAAPGVVESVLGGQAVIGAPSVLEPASASASSEDWMPHSGRVSSFYAQGLVSGDVNDHYGSEIATQLEYAPFGIGTGLCTGLADVAYQNEGLTLQPCNSAKTVWILDFADSPATAPTYFPIVSGSITDFSRPFAMSLVPAEYESAQQLLQIRVRRLQFQTDEHTLPDTQLWGNHVGPYTSGS